MKELERAINPTTGEAIKYLEGMIFPQDFSPSTLRAVAVNKMAIAALREKLAPRQLTLDELREMDGRPVWIHWLNEMQNDRWVIWNKPWGGTMFDLDDPAVRYGEKFLAYDRPPRGDRL